MKTFFLLSILLVIPALVSARIGETREQCEARYGKPAADEPADTTDTMHHKAGYKVICTYYEGKCEKISFAHEKDATGRASPLSESEIMTLLQSNSGGKPWAKTYENTEKGFCCWEFQNLEAVYGAAPTPRLIINTKSYEERRQASEEAKDKAKLKDF